MDDIEQTNKKHLNPKSGRKFRENNKIKLTEINKVDYKDSRGQSFSKAKKIINKPNAKAFAIQNIAKAKKKVSLVVDRQTSKHTFRTLSDQYLNAPQLIALVGPQNSGKSTLLRTLMRHYTGHRMTVQGPVTVVTSKKKRATFFECPNDLHSQIDVAKTADMILMMIDVKQGIQNETFEFIELLNPHGIPRMKLIFTHLDEFKKHDKELLKKMKMITKRIQMEVHATTFKLSEFKANRTASNSEYKIEEVKNLARLIGQKNPLPNEWRENHPYVLVDRLEKVTRDQLQGEATEDSIKFYGYVRGCTMSADITRMHLMGVADLAIESVEPLPEPCPTPYQESKIPKKRAPLEIKDRKAYAPMCGYGGVLKDSDGFHIVSDTMDTIEDKKDKYSKKKNHKDTSDDEENNHNDTVATGAVKSSLIQDLDESDSSDGREDESVVCDFDEDDEDIEDEDEDMEDDEDKDMEDDEDKDMEDDEDEDMDDDEDEDDDHNEEEQRNINGKRQRNGFSKDKSGPTAKKRCFGSESETKNLVSGFEDLQDELKTNTSRINYYSLAYDKDYVCNMSALENAQNVNKELSLDLFVTGKWDENEDASTLLKKDDESRKKLNGKSDKDEDFDEDEDEEDFDSDENEDEEDDEENEDEEIDDGDDIDEEDEDNEMEVDSEEEDYEEDSEMGNEDSDDDDEKDEHEEEAENTIQKSTNLFEGLIPDTAALTDFQKKMLERDSKTKRQKKLEKKAKHKLLFDNLYDQKQGDTTANAFFDKWKQSNEEQEQKNKVAFEHLDNEESYKITGLKPGSYVCIIIKKVPKGFFANFSATRPVILGGLSAGEESYAMLTASFKLSRHFDIKNVFKTGDPLCLSIGWRRIQSFCYYFKEEDNHRKTYLKYSEKKGLYCKVAFFAPVVPVKTGFSAFINYEYHEKFRLAALGAVLSKDDTVDIKKKLKRIGEPFKIFKKTAFIKNMFSEELEVVENVNSLIKTTSGIRGCIKKALTPNIDGCEPGSFRATFEAPIFLTDIVSMTCWVTVNKLLHECIVVQNLLVGPGERFDYFLLWNDFKKDRGIALPYENADSKYKKIVRQPFVAPPIKLAKKVIDKLPFINRPVEPTLEDQFQKNRPKVVLDAKESQKAQLLDALNYTKVERRSKMLKDKQKFGVLKSKKMKAIEEKALEKTKQKRKKFFKSKSIKSGEAKKKPDNKD